MNAGFAPRLLRGEATPRLVSVVVPFLNERDTLPTLVDRVSTVLHDAGESFEIVLVDDGSTDGSGEVAAELARRCPPVRLITFRRNFGKAAALSAGLGEARGDLIVTMDADLQDIPEELPRFLEQIEAGYDVVSGWKRKRHDPLSKTLPSKVFNLVLSSAFSLRLHDFNCGFKAYTRDAADHLRRRLYGDLHRFTPALLHSAGFRITELPIKHEPRRFGHSKFGSGRLMRGLLDLLTVLLLTRYRSRPLHFFGGIGLAIGALGALGLIYLTALWFLGMGPIGDRPLLLFSIMASLAGLQFIGVGLVGELIVVSKGGQGGHYVLDDRRAVIDGPEEATAHAR
ncbi:sugar transferase [Roseivivax marinus]|uniref:Sugar transferase n=1 Tax=Roseivivax marinus TaxID=1379903 RepID=W4HRY6_9RHOB|nr:glycosyltransferase family 2 protein [Roseivivax marinus]ETW14785.1 sugar transferase [Roseivivax marinus]UMA65986.1 glycosyltransferase family 2 protein [Roseivivax marinus]